MAAMSSRYTGPAMTLDNMRSIGVRSIEAACECGRRALMDVSGLPGEVEVPALRRHLICSSCSARPNDVRPDWLEYIRPGMGRPWP